jgi:hypothetical protein
LKLQVTIKQVVKQLTFHWDEKGKSVHLTYVTGAGDYVQL